MSILVQESKDPEIRDLLTRRACQQAELRANISVVQRLLLEDDNADVAGMTRAFDGLTTAMDKETRLVCELRQRASKYDLDMTSVDQAEQSINKEARKAALDAQEWLGAIKALKARLGTVKVSPQAPPLKEPGSSARTELTTHNFEELSIRQREVIDDQDQQLSSLHSTVHSLQARMAELDETKSMVADLRSALTKQQEEREANETYYQDTITKLRRDLQDDDRQRARATETTEPRSSSPTEPHVRFSGFQDDYRRSSIQQDDLLAMSQVLHRSNVDLLRNMMNESGLQQKKFLDNMQAPKVKIKEFNGEVIKYRSFIARFDDMVGNSDSSYSIKLNTLLQFCGEKVLQHLGCCEFQSSREGYLTARRILKERYGRSHMIIQAWLEKLMAYQKLKTGEQLQLFASDLKSCKLTLEELNSVEELDNSDKKRLIVSKLPSYIQNRWRKKVREAEEEDSNVKIDVLILMIGEAADEQNHPVYGPDSIAKAVATWDHPTSGKPSGGAKKKASYMTSPGTTSDEVVEEKPAAKKKSVDAKRAPVREPCECCGESHFTRLCEKFKAMSSADKLKFVRDQKMCYLCLSPKHAVSECVFTWRCQRTPCVEKHNNVLHDALEAEMLKKAKEGSDVKSSSMRITVSKPDVSRPVVADDRMEMTSAMVTRADIKEYALPVSAVTISGLAGTCDSYAMHDTGGGFTAITKKLKERAGILAIKTAYFKMSTLAGDEFLDVELVTFPIREKGSDQVHLVFNAVVLDRELVDPRYASVLRQLDSHSHLKNLNLLILDDDDVGLLIGQDNAHLMRRQSEVKGRHSYGPYAVQTPIGWTVQGFGMDGSTEARYPAYRLSRCSDEKSIVDKKADEMLHLAVERMMALDEVPEVKMMSPTNRDIVKMWDQTTRLVDGHVEIRIPVKKEKLCLPNNRGAVEKRMHSLGRRLRKDPALHEMFKDAMADNLKEGYAERVSEVAEAGEEWFTPLQPVTSDRKPGKCRIVGDLSIRHMEACLNEAVHQGPNMTSHVLDNLLKFRRYKVAVVGDIRSMYNRVKVPREQRCYLKFLYWKNGDVDEEFEEYQMTTHMFGATWAPSACIYAMRWLARLQSEGVDEDVIELLMRHFYVDDLLSSLLDCETGLRVLQGVRAVLGQGGFELLKIGSNVVAIVESVPEADRARVFEDVLLSVDGEAKEMTLGGVWMPQRDVIGFKTVAKKVTYTRRGVLSVMSSLFDPMGLVSPFVLLARILLQEICKAGYAWDDDLDDSYRRRWDDWLRDLDVVTKFELPRWLGFSDASGVTYQLQTFVDASEQGYGSVTYLGIKNEHGSILELNLIAAKSKVTPVKVITIPRLELCSAVVGVKMTKSITEYLEVEMEPANYWSDSTIVLYYINGKPWQYKTFVANRVVFIQENTNVSQWRHVAGVDNIADVASRGMSGEDMIENDSWVNGPQFLRDVENWPAPFHHQSQEVNTDSFELKKLCHLKFHMVRLVNDESEVTCKKLLERYSRWNILVRAICIWHRLVHLVKDRKKQTGRFTADEVAAAEMAVVGLAQQVYLTPGQRSSKLFDKLFPFTDDGILRVGGRLMMANLTYEEKHPCIFPRSPVQDVYIFHVHERQGHSGVDKTYYAARQKFWILGGRASVKKVVNDCVTCRKIRGRFQEQIMAPLPSFRVEEGKMPFEKVGVDYFGPFYCKFGRGTVKRYACMITDLVIRATHVEIVPDLTSSAFINALQRFISVRGKPVLIVSDNGTNFVGANRELKEAVKKWNMKKAGDFMAEEGIKWVFNTPTASHHGGVWERLIRSFRTLALAVMKDQELTEDSLRTFACIITQIMNSRPLTKMTENPQDPLPITPEHLLNLRKAEGIVGDYSKGDVIRGRWKQLQYLGEKFWKRWVSEYLKELQLRVKWNKETKDVKKGDVVLVADLSLPRLHWPLGLVTEVIVGRDHHVRSVKMKTEKGEMIRPITKIINLECS